MDDSSKSFGWVIKRDKYSWWYECSSCHSHPPLNQYRTEWLSSYCPSCGEKMGFIEEPTENDMR